MWMERNPTASVPTVSRSLFALVAAAGLLLALAPASLAQNDDAQPEKLSKLRTDLYLRATRAPLADLESDVNRIAVLSETCRADNGSKACGLPDKALESEKLEERYAYYVKGPVEAHPKGHGPRIDRRNWAGSGAPAQR
jgi:hypothetical protein